MDSPMIKFSEDVTNEFHYACVNSELDKVHKLLTKKEVIDVKQLEEKGTLFISVKEGHEKVVNVLLQIGVNANNKPGLLTYSIIKWAISLKGNFAIVKSLLKHGADVHHQNLLKETPLHFACMIGCLEITKELLKHNPDVNAVCEDDNGLKTPLMLASESGSLDVMEELVMHGADIDFKDANLGTALHLATQCEGENVENIKTLLKYGCNTNARAKLSAEGVELPMCTAFELALKMKSIVIVKTIVFHEIM